jgi:hypothetical protein
MISVIGLVIAYIGLIKCRNETVDSDEIEEGGEYQKF